nr:cytochrome b6/f complex subunit IV [Ottelia alismoides]
MGVMSGSLGG